MARQINDYDKDLLPDILDKVIGTDAQTGKTYNYRLKEMFELLNTVFSKNLLVYRYADANNTQSHLYNGYMTADSDDIASVTQIKINKNSKNGDDVSSLIEAIAATILTDPVLITFTNSDEPSNYGSYNVSGVTDNLSHFVLDVNISGAFSNGSFIDEEVYLGQTGFGSSVGSYSPAEIKALYESNANTNAFTDADEAKLDGINDRSKSVEDMFSISTNTTGDTVVVESYVEGLNYGGGIFKKLDIKESSGVTFDKSSSQYMSGTSLGIVISSESVLKFKIKFNEFTSSGESSVDIFNLPDVGAEISFRYYTLGSITHSGLSNLKVTDQDGLVLSNSASAATNLILGEWYDVEATLSNSGTINTITSLTSDSKYISCSMSYFSIGGEEFNMDEGSGTVTYSQNSKQISLFNTPDWESFVDGGVYLSDGNVLYKRIVENNIITPYDFGAISNRDTGKFANDASPAIQSAFDSIYNVEIPTGCFYIASGLTISKPKKIKMFGISTRDNRDNDFIDGKRTTVIYSNQDIDYLTIKSENVMIEEGLFWLKNSTGHTKSAIVYKSEGYIWGGELKNIGIVGNLAELSTTGGGSTGVLFDLEAPEGTQGVIHNINISGVIHFCGKGLATSVSTSGEGTFMNTCYMKLQMNGCKQYVDFSYHNIEQLRLEITSQDYDNVLTTEEINNKLYAYDINATSSYIDVDLWDRGTDGIPIGTNRHGSLFLNFTGKYSSFGTRTLSTFSYTGDPFPIDFNGYNINSTFRIQDPKSFVFSDKGGMISQLNNGVRYLGNTNQVDYDGYEAPNFDWFSSNLLPADDAGNTTTLSRDTGFDINYPSWLLQNNEYTSAHRFSDYTNSNQFAEIVVDCRGYVEASIEGIYLKLAQTPCHKVQLIAYFDGGAVEDYMYEANGWYEDEALFDLYPRLYPYNVSNLDYFIIRIIGQQSHNYTLIEDIMVKFRNNENPPYLHIGGNQDIKGYLGTNSGIRLTDDVNKTGTVISLVSATGYTYNMGAASNATTYTTGSKKPMGNAVCRINTTTQPKVDGLDPISGATWVANTDMHMVVQTLDGIVVQYFFLEL